MIYTIGEALIDMIPCGKGKSLFDSECYSRQAGGAPANVAAAVAKLGARSAFISRLGGDGFGRYIEQTLKDIGVDTSMIIFDEKYLTGIVYVALSGSGDREFFSSRTGSADIYLTPENVDCTRFKADDILHFCSVELLEAPVKYAHIKAIESMINAGGKVSFDINLRFMLWDSPENLFKAVWEFLHYPDYLKVSREEAEFLTGETDKFLQAEKFYAQGERLKFIIISDGSNGSDVFIKNGQTFHTPAYGDTVVDTTGAGDCFIGAVLYGIDKLGHEPNQNELKFILTFASAAAGIEVGRRGAIESLPTALEVMEFLRNFKKIN